MEQSVWADGDSSKHTQPNPNIFQNPQVRQVRMATPDPNAAPTLHNPAVALQTSGVDGSMTRANSKGVPRSRATGRSSNAFSPPPSHRADSAIGFQPAPFTNKTNEARQTALPRSSQSARPSIFDHSTPAPTITSTSTYAMPSRSYYAPHNRNKNENDRPTLRDSSQDGEQWRIEEGNKFVPFLTHFENEREGKFNCINDEGTRNTFKYDDRDAPHTFQATLRYDDDTEPVPRVAPVRITAPSTTNTATKAGQADMVKENARVEMEKALGKQKEQEEKDAVLERESEEREAIEDAAHVAEMQEEAERKAELNRQRYEVEVHNTTSDATTSSLPSEPEPPAQESNLDVRFATVHDRLLELIDLKDKTANFLKKAQDKLVDTEEKIRAQFDQLRILRQEQALTDRLRSAK